MQREIILIFAFQLKKNKERLFYIFSIFHTKKRTVPRTERVKGVRSWNVPAHISVASCALSLSFTFIFTHTHGKSQEDKCTYRERIKPGGTDRYSSNRERKRERLTLIGVIKTTQQSIKPWHCGTTEESAQLVVFVCARNSFPRWCV